MRVIGLVVVLAVSLILAPFAIEAQPTARMYQIGLLTLGADPARSGFWQKFLEALRELNYVEGRNLIVRRAFANGRVNRLPRLAADLVQAKVDVIVTTSTQETMAAEQASSTIPIVMTVAPDPVEQGLVASLARPGGNVTGLTSMAPGTSQKFVELLREIVPSAARFAVPVPGPNAPATEIRRELEAADLEHRYPGWRLSISFVCRLGLCHYLPFGPRGSMVSGAMRVLPPRRLD